MSRFTDAKQSDRCQHVIVLRDKTFAQCGRHKAVGEYCRQHSSDKETFKRLLNMSEYQHQNGPFKQRTRRHGDYLYAQDREKFEVDMQDWIAKGRPSAL